MGLTCGIFYTSSKSFISFIRLYNIGEARQIQVINLDNFPDVCFPLSPCMLSSSLRWLEADVQIYRCVVSIWSPKICWLIQCRRWIITWLKINSPSTSGRSILEGIVSSHLGLRMRIFVRRSFRKSKPDNRTEETLLIEFCIMDLGLLFLLRILLSYTLFLKHWSFYHMGRGR
jgi:hypothetical protein